MFLSALVSRLELDGSLVIDLVDEQGPELRLGAYASGMPWEWKEGNRWVGTDHDYGVLLIHDAHAARPDLPVSRYLTSVPAEIRSALNRIRTCQATVLQLCARWPSARDLLQTNPVLLWLAAERYATEPKDRHHLQQQLKMPQRLLLEWILRTPVRPAQVRFLGRIVLNAGGAAVLDLTRQLVVDQATVMKLVHWPRIPSWLLGLFVEEPAIAELNWLKKEIARANDEWAVGRIVESRRRFVRDTVRILGLLRRIWIRRLMTSDGAGAGRASRRCTTG